MTQMNGIAVVIRDTWNFSVLHLALFNVASSLFTNVPTKVVPYGRLNSHMRQFA
jgi:hypothetical protein